MISAMNIKNYYAQYFEQFTAEKYERYVESLDTAIGFQYRFNPSPVLLPQSKFEKLVAITDSVVKLLQNPAYHQCVTSTPWFLPQQPMQPHDYMGCVDFHISDETEKIIEVNFCPPGHLGFTELMEEKFLNAFDLPYASRVNKGFERALVESVTGNYRHRKIAIAVNHTAVSHFHYAHYKYFEQLFSKYDVESRVQYAAEVEFDEEDYPVWEGVRYDRIFNLVIPRIWEYNREIFSQYTRAFELHPEMFMPNPLGWKLGKKSFLATAYNLRSESFGLAKDDLENIVNASLKTHLLSAFQTHEQVLEEYGDEKSIVLKPLDNYRANGLFVRPTIEKLKQLFENERGSYVVQQFFEPPVIPCIHTDRSIYTNAFETRMHFLHGKCFGVRGYFFTDLKSADDNTPVIVV